MVKQFFSYAGAKSWNNLINELESTSSYPEFNLWKQIILICISIHFSPVIWASDSLSDLCVEIAFTQLLVNMKSQKLLITVLIIQWSATMKVAYLGFHKEGGKFSLATSAHTHKGGG